MKKTREITRIFIHCSGVEKDQSAEEIRAYHMKPVSNGGRGFDDIGYHFVIRQDGTIQTGRPEERIGAHAQGANVDSIGVCLTGLWKFTLEQIESMDVLVRSLMNKYGLTWNDIFAHSECATAQEQKKTCPNIPGSMLRAYFKKGELK